MGSNLWVNTACRFGLAVALLGASQNASADTLDFFENFKGHIDIPEIARLKITGPSWISDLGLAPEEWTLPIAVTPDPPLPPDRPAPQFSTPPGGSGTPNSATELFPLSLSGLDGSSASGLDRARAVPAPSSLVPMAFLAVLVRRRRK